MLKQDETSDPASCLNRARSDEWLFVLLGRDLAAPAAVRAWIEERVRLGKNRREDAQIVEAEAWIAAAGKERPRLPLAEGSLLDALDRLGDGWHAVGVSLGDRGLKGRKGSNCDCPCPATSAASSPATGSR